MQNRHQPTPFPQQQGVKWYFIIRNLASCKHCNFRTIILTYPQFFITTFHSVLHLLPQIWAKDYQERERNLASPACSCSPGHQKYNTSLERVMPGSTVPQLVGPEILRCAFPFLCWASSPGPVTCQASVLSQSYSPCPMKEQS